MKKKALWKDIIKEIWQTKSRFLSIFAIITLGVAFYAGISATGPDMLNTADHYYTQKNLMDIQVASTYGLNDDDLDLLSSVENAKVTGGYSQDVLLDGNGSTVKIVSFAENTGESQNDYEVISGRLPEASGEIAIDNRSVFTDVYSLGDTVTLSTDDSDTDLSDVFETTAYEIVGFVNSPMYIEHITRGNTTIGTGTLDGFAVVSEEDFKLDLYTQAYLTFSDLSAMTAYSEEYESGVDSYTETIEQLLESRPEERLEEIRSEGQKEITEAQAEIDEARQQLADGETELADARSELERGSSEYQNGLAVIETEVSQAQQEIDSNLEELQNGREELESNRAALNAGQAELDEAWAAFEAQRTPVTNQIENGGLFLANARAVLQMPAEEVPAETQSAIIGSANGISISLGELFTLYFGGSVPADEVEAALIEFEGSLEESRAQLLEAENELLANQQQLDQARQEIQEAEAEIAAGESALADAQAQLDQEQADSEAELAAANEELTAAQAEYDQAAAEFETQRAEAEEEIADGEAEISAAQQELDKLSLPEYFVLDRTMNPGYAEYSDNAERISAIAQVFPVFFFLIAALVCLTTMTRMVEEQRQQIGTLKALGYSDWDISKKFLVYSLIASVSGTTLGLIIGYQMFPRIIFDAYGSMYNLSSVQISYYLNYGIISFVVASLGTAAAAWIASRVELRSNAAALMRPKAPKIGKRIMLERLSFIWNRLSFTHKVTARNLFRYKQRMLMTVLGVAGCTALMLTGFGLTDSITDVAELQYGKVMHYDAIVSLDTEADEQELDDYQQIINEQEEIVSALNVFQETHTAEAEGVNTQDVMLYIPETTENFEDYVLLNDRLSGERYTLSSDGVIITEKLAELFELEAGDVLTLRDASNDSYDVTIDAVAENYAGHYIYMDPLYYEEIFGESADFNAQLLMYDQPESWEEELGTVLTAQPGVMAVSFISQISGSFEETMNSLEIVTLVLIVSAALLAFVVLYNLTNINVSERVRELSTIKVLGFYDAEVTMYIYRENILLTLMGILAGSLLGILLHSFVLSTAEVDILMFSRTIHPMSYLYSAVLTFLFSGIVMVAMHLKLKKINMIEALKSVD